MINMEKVTIGTLNLCLGLKGKKDLVKNILLENKIDILAMQETEIEPNFDMNNLRIPGFTLETEMNNHKIRTAFYISNNLNYKRRCDLEENNSHLIVIDFEDGKKTRRVINIYRSFNPLNETARELFSRQLDLIGNAFNQNCTLLGDFNLDYSRKHDISYSGSGLFELLDLRLGPLNLVQIVEFYTWSRLVGLNLRKSCIDHVYVKELNSVHSVTNLKPCFGDHVI